MGNKYASIHVYGNDKEKIIKSILQNYNDMADNLLWNNFMNEMKQTNPEGYKQLISKSNLRFSNILVISTPQYISIYDKTNAFETIQNKIKKLSLKLDSLVIYTSNFDNDIFLIGAYRAGELITSGKFGDELSVYGMKHKDINIDKLCEILHVDKTKSICSLNSLKDVDEIEEIIEKYLKIKLNLNMEDVKEDISYKETYTDNTFHIYSKDDL